MRARKPGPLYRRVVWWLLGYLALLSIAVFSVGNYVHEHAEHAAWRAFVERAKLGRAVAELERDMRFVWLEDLRAGFGRWAKLRGLLRRAAPAPLRTAPPPPR